MTSDRMRRRLEALLDEADEAVSRTDWTGVAERARAVLALEPDNADALGFLRMAEANLGAPLATSARTPEAPALPPVAPQPESFAAGRYHVRRFLGEGGKKRVFLAHDQLLDRDVAFALIKTDGLDEVGRERITREAQAMGRLGAHPNLVTIFDIGEEGGAPFVVTELMGGGDVEAVLADGVPPLARTLEIAKGVAKGLAFAHAQGIVHRDLKPGNVWLTAPSSAGGDGVAKIGDFGLAVALNRSRLTLHGLMVGTVAYMPPEQALGGEVTPQADLYSLGAMLYELVTGKPPFQGDSPTAVISQHINSTPVAPSWNSEHCPPDLEALILKLLAKVPADRPASAAEVVAALERVDPEAKSASHSDSQANPLDRLARGVFVGRERELERLRGALDDALAGHGSVVMLVGEPGIGKTRTTQELETYARMRGAQVLWGRAHESAGAPPYWPWVYVARAYRDQNDDETRRREWEPYAVELQRIFAGLRALFPHLPDPPAVESEETQFALFDAMSGFLHTVAARVPLVIVLDDLHWADRATLQLLSHLARDLARARIVVLGTYRDTDLDRRHPLSQALGEMNREALFQRIGLRGLTRDEVGAYIAQAAGIAPPPLLVSRVFEETEGNPFFLSQVVNLMTQEGTLTSSTNPDVAIPEGVREALGRRLDRLSEEANALLTMLAVVGRECDHALAKELSGHDDETLLGLLEEAVRARVLEELGPNTYRFTHALMVETLLNEVTAARRVRLHARIAEALERRYGETAEQLPQLANHYTEAAVLGSEYTAKAATYTAHAGDQAKMAGAWTDAITHYLRSLEFRTTDESSDGRAELLCQVAHCQSVMGEWSAAQDSLAEAMQYFRAVGDDRRFAEVAQVALGQPGLSFTERQKIAEPAASAARKVGSAKLEALVLLAAAIGNPTSRDEAISKAMRALAVENDRTLRARMLHQETIRALAQFHVDEVPGLARSTFAALDAIGEYRAARNALYFWEAHAHLFAGRIEACEQTMRESLDYEQRRHVPATSALGLIVLALARGDLAAAQELQTRFEPSFDSIGRSDAAQRIAIYRGALDEAAAALAEWPGRLEMTSRASTAARAWLAAARGESEEAVRLAMEFALSAESAVGVPVGWGEPEVQALQDAAQLAELASLLPASAARAPYERLVRFERLRAAERTLHLGLSLDRARGLLALSLERWDDARQWLEAGLDWCHGWQLHIEAGRCLQGLAEVAERRGDIETARAHLDTAGELFAKYGAKLYLDQVLAKKQVLRA